MLPSKKIYGLTGCKELLYWWFLCTPTCQQMIAMQQTKAESSHVLGEKFKILG